MTTEAAILSRRAITICISMLGWVLCAYLALRSTQIAHPTALIPDLCALFFGSSCDETLSGPAAWHMGYPLTGWGLAYFGALGLLLSLNKPFSDYVVVVLAALGVGASILLSGLIIKAGLSCPLCLGVHLVNVLAFAALLRSVQLPTFFGSQPQHTTLRSAAGWAIVLLFLGAAGSMSELYVLEHYVGKQAAVDLDEVAQKFQDETVYSIPKSSQQTYLGSADAPVQVVVFSSFQCPACKRFAPSLETLHQKFGPNVGITFRNFPLSLACNPRMSADMQPRACGAAFAAAAAHRQKRFWTFHDQLFQSNLEADEKTLATIARTSGLDIKQWESDRQSEAVKETVSNDVQTAYQLGINATPTVFINGRRVSNFQESTLAFLIQHELEKRPD